MNRNLNPEQFHFAGWHADNEGGFALDPDHEHQENRLGAEPGGLYVTHHPEVWASPGATLHEVWQRTPPSEASTYERVVPYDDVVLGKSYPYDPAHKPSLPSHRS